MNTKKVSRSALAVCFASALSAGLVVGTTTSADAAVVKKDGVKFSCKATNPAITGFFGTKVFTAGGSANVPLKVKAGSTYSAKNIKLRITVPGSVTSILSQGGAKKLKGTAKASFWLQQKKQKVEVKINGLSAPWTKIPNGKPMTLVAPGKAPAITVPKNLKGKVALNMPSAFTMQAQFQPGVFGEKGTGVNCKLNKGQKIKLATITVTK